MYFYGTRNEPDKKYSECYSGFEVLYVTLFWTDSFPPNDYIGENHIQTKRWGWCSGWKLELGWTIYMFKSP